MTAPDGSPVALHSRRMLFERTLRDVAARQPRLRLVTGHVDGVRRQRGRAVGVTVDGWHVAADLVIDAAGRASRVMGELRRPGEGGPCGASYISRQYRLLDSAAPGPTNSPIGLSLGLADYFAVMFLHDNRTFSITITHDGTDGRLRRLRHPEVYEAAVRSIPLLADWIDPDRARPLTPVLPGGRLYNSYRGQLDDGGRPELPGLVAVGDAVCTTTPLAGRGVALAFLQAQALVGFLTSNRTMSSKPPPSSTAGAVRTCGRGSPTMCTATATDCDAGPAAMSNLDSPLPSDLVVAAAGADPTLRAAVLPYDRMLALPSSLDDLQDRARAVYASGWRPRVALGPTREELGQLCQELDRDRQEELVDCPV